MSERESASDYVDLAAADWRLSAACAGRDQRLWFTAPVADPVAAGVACRVCASCPVQVQCAAEAERLRRTGEPLYGTWAGHWYSA
jgi:hypothetical protein